MPPELAAIVNLHDEGPAATPSIISAWRAAEAASRAGIDVEFVLVLDRASDETASVAQTWETRGARIVRADCGDLGEARNRAANECEAEWVAFLDADDLWGEHWLLQAHAAASMTPPRSTIDVWHPQVNVIFGDHHSLLHHVASTDDAFSWDRFRLHNAWTALAFVRRAHLLALPYPRNDLSEGFGFEDWSWNMEVLRRGGRHQVVPDSCHFVRRLDNGSLLHQSRAALRSPYPADGTVARLAEADLPGATTAVSALTEVDSQLPPTHRDAEVALSAPILEQVRLATAIEPTIAETLRASGTPRRLPQNFTTHVGRKQQVLEAVSLTLQARSFPTAADLIDAVPAIADLSLDERAQLVADVLLDPGTQNMPRGDNRWVREALSAYPQLRKATW